MRVDRAHTAAIHANLSQSATRDEARRISTAGSMHNVWRRAAYTMLLGAASVCLLAGAPAWADTHTASSLQELQQAIQDANGDTNPPVVIKLDSDITVPSSATLTTITRNLTLDTNGHTLNGASGSTAHRDGGHVSLVTDSDSSLTVKGKFRGGDGAGGNGGGKGDDGDKGDDGADGSAGSGGSGSDGSAGSMGGAGGAGGTGVQFNGKVLSNTGEIAGGNGGAGGVGGQGGSGGSGGMVVRAFLKVEQAVALANQEAKAVVVAMVLMVVMEATAEKVVQVAQGLFL